MKSVALIGVGLMGGSIALALRKHAPEVKVSAYARRTETREACLTMGIADAVFDTPAAAVSGAELVVICTPVSRIPEMMISLESALEPGAVVTDVGSTKAWLLAQLADRPFVGSHPMCGSEKTGLESATAELYEGAVCVVTDNVVAPFWEMIGCKVVEMDAARHDELVALTSHVPHLTASALVLAATGGELCPNFASLCGTGFRDTTRVASGDPGMWRDIVQSNAPAISKNLRSVAGSLTEFADLIDQQEFEQVELLLARAAELRDSIYSDQKEN